ncbi:MAG: AAA family ATPase [Phycisphaerae bacterium]|jgi:hypothetical protein
MRIKSFSFTDPVNSWELEKSYFSDVNLLVGISGVGKTQILNSLLIVADIAAGRTYNGISWELCFTSTNRSEFVWKGAFDRVEHLAEKSISVAKFISSSEKPGITSESLTVDGQVVIERDNHGILLQGQKMPRLNASESALSLLRCEDAVQSAFTELSGIVSSSTVFEEHSPEMLNLTEFEIALSRLTNLDDIRRAALPTPIKLSLIYSNCPDTFAQIRDEFIDVFAQVEDVAINNNEQFINGRVVIYPTVLIKERGVSGWVNQKRLSAGMHKTFFQIAQSHLWQKGSVILIDEFENSLGINCISILTDIILSQAGRLQFIITTHHPYIINNIDQKHWKVVVRKQGKVQIMDAASLGLGKSNHEAFIQLVNSQQYIDGISVQ